MQAKLFSALVFAFSASAALAAPSEAAKQELIAIVNSYSSFSANFTQTASSPKGAVISQSSGTIKALKPGFLLMHTTSPNELFLSVKGKEVSNYDPFVEQVTISTLSPNEAVPFAYLLSAGQQEWNNVKVEKVKSCYVIQDGGDKQFKRVQVCTNGKALSAITFYENNGNTNRYTLSKFKAGGLRPANFTLTYPQGTQVQRVK